MLPKTVASCAGALGSQAFGLNGLIWIEVLELFGVKSCYQQIK